MLIHVNDVYPQPRQIETIAECLRNGGVIIYPTDTIYGLGCSIHNLAAIEKIGAIKKINIEKTHLSFVCDNLSHLSLYTKSISTPLYRILKNHLPGPYTFILNASKEVPRILKNKKNTVGIRVPNNKIAQAIVSALGHPIISTSLPGQLVEEFVDPEIIFANFNELVDIIVDGGIGNATPSTIVDCTTETPIVVREGAGFFATEE
jgi:tRNA threonylcarbamoyl adenosine modification protein (Sua5/YciO/YrdC/YwlC family)